MPGYTNPVKDVNPTDKVFDPETNRIFLRSLWVGTFLEVISAFDFLFKPVDKELKAKQWRRLIQHKGSLFRSPFEDLSFESTECIVAKGDLPGFAACKPLPQPFPCNPSSELATWETELHRRAREELELGSFPSSEADPSGPTVALCVVLCARWGYRLPESFDEQPESFISQVWRLLPPPRGQVKVVGGGGLEASIGAALRSSFDSGTTLGKEAFYYEHEWPGGSDQPDGETKILESLISTLADRLKKEPDLLVVQLGAGDSTKMEPLLDQLDSQGIHCRYWIVDINEKVLDNRVRQLHEKYTHVECSGLYGSFEDGAATAAIQPSSSKVIISLGSTATNFGYGQTLKNLRTYCNIADLLVLGHQGPGGDMFCHDACHTEQSKSFIWDGLSNTANRILAAPVFNTEEWEIGCNIQDEPWRHDFIFRHQGKERFWGFSSTKYTTTEFSTMTMLAGAPSPEVYSHPETALKVYVVDCARVSNTKGKHPSREDWVLPTDIFFFRHCKSASNLPGTRPGFDLAASSEDESLRLIRDMKDGKPVQIFNGTYLMDGLTIEGKKEAVQQLPRPLDNVCRIVSSPCTRAIQTASLASPSFNLAESQVGKSRNSTIHIDKRLQEATPWPQDMEPLLTKEGDRTYTTYLEIKGGNGSDAGDVVGEAEVDYTNAIWREVGMQGNLQTVDGRMEALEHPETLDQVKERCQSFLEEELIAAHKDYEEHIRSGKEGTPKRVWVGHGGAINLLEGKYHCEYAKDAHDHWAWRGSGALSHGEFRVFNLCLKGDGSVVLKEKPWDKDDAEAYGRRYKHFDSDPSLQYRNPDGSLVDQERGYEAFFSRVRKDVIHVAQDKRRVLRELLGWRGRQGAPKSGGDTEM
ncbi:hypothetical protein QQX98_006974 [Neonectria punicea]|uniref:Histidine-specific methyltransferase SAM-dependent domain-containing protein n=1 Tax=Neonectria punicea TaxID=979145 RepID=A0ABR1GZD0_9HYPO